MNGLQRRIMSSQEKALASQAAIVVRPGEVEVDRRVFPLGDGDRLEVVEHSEWQQLAMAIVVGTFLVLLGVGMMWAGAPPFFYLATMLGGLLTVAASWMGERTRPRVWELVARGPGQPVSVAFSYDRAPLQRAVEQFGQLRAGAAAARPAAGARIEKLLLDLRGLPTQARLMVLRAAARELSGQLGPEERERFVREVFAELRTPAPTEEAPAAAH